MMEVNRSSLLAKLKKAVKPKKSVQAGSSSSVGATAPEIVSIVEALPVQAIGPEEARPEEVGRGEHEPSFGEAVALEVLAALHEEEEEEEEDVEVFSLQPHKRSKVSSELCGMEAGEFISTPSSRLYSPIPERLVTPPLSRLRLRSPQKGR